MGGSSWAFVCILCVACAVVAVHADVAEVDAHGSSADALDQLREALATQTQLVDDLTKQLAEAEERAMEAEEATDAVSRHFERRVTSLQTELEDTKARLDEQLVLSRQTEERLHELQAKCDGASESSANGACDCARDCPCTAPDPKTARHEELRDEIERLFQTEQARQRRLQHDDADSADNGPKEISIHCSSGISVSIVDLDVAQRDRNECMVLNVNGQDVSSRLVLFCDGTSNMGSGDGDSE